MFSCSIFEAVVEASVENAECTLAAFFHCLIFFLRSRYVIKLVARLRMCKVARVFYVLLQ